MIVGLGVDAAEVERFIDWANYAPERLAKVLTDREVAYCLSVPAKSAERFAARFAAKEAAFKALNAFFASPFGLMDFCQSVEVVLAPSGAPFLDVQFNKLGIAKPLSLLVTITHTNLVAVAVVIAQEVGS